MLQNIDEIFKFLGRAQQRRRRQTHKANVT